MTLWDEQFEGHEVFPALQQVSEQLDQIEPQLEDTQQREAHERLRSVVSYTRETLGTVDPQLVVLGHLDHIRDQASQITSYLQQFGEAPQQALLDNANSHADAILAQVHSLRPLTTTQDVEGLQAAVSSFRRSIGQLARHLEGELEAADASARRLAERLDVQEQTLDERLAAQEKKVEAQETRIDTILGQYQSQFADEQGQRATQFSDVLERTRTQASEAIDEVKDDIAQAVAEAQTKASGTLSATRSATEKELSELKAEVERRLEELNELRAEAERAVGATGAAVLAGGYQIAANRETKAANRWRWVAAGAFIGATLVAAFAVAYGISEGFDLERFLAKVTIGLPIIALAYYAAHESSKHRDQARINRQVELQLASLDAYLRELPETQRYEIKGDLADGFFETGLRAVRAAEDTGRRQRRGGKGEPEEEADE